MKKLISLIVGLSALSLSSIANAQALPYANITTTQLDQNGNYQRTVTPTGGGVLGNYVYIDGNGQPQIDAPGLTTPGTATGIVVNAQQKLRRSVLKVTVPFGVFSAAAKTADVTIATIQAKCRIVGCIMDITTTFTGSGETAATMKLGTAAGGAQVMASEDAFTTATTWGLADADMGSGLTRAASIQGGLLPSWTASTNISARLTTTTNNTSSLTAGSVTFYLITEQL